MAKYVKHKNILNPNNSSGNTCIEFESVTTLEQINIGLPSFVLPTQAIKEMHIFLIGEGDFILNVLLYIDMVTNMINILDILISWLLTWHNASHHALDHIIKATVHLK